MAKDPATMTPEEIATAQQELAAQQAEIDRQRAEMDRLRMANAPVGEQQAAIEKELAENPRDVTIPGGRYKRGDIWVNAEGRQIDKNGKVIKQPDEE